MTAIGLTASEENDGGNRWTADKLLVPASVLSEWFEFRWVQIAPML